MRQREAVWLGGEVVPTPPHTRAFSVQRRGPWRPKESSVPVTLPPPPASAKTLGAVDLGSEGSSHSCALLWHGPSWQDGLMVKTVGSLITAWVPIPTLPLLAGWPGKWLNMSGLQCSPLYNGNNNSSPFIELRRKNVRVCKVFDTIVRHPESVQYVLLIVLQTTSYFSCFFVPKIRILVVLL